ncbi:MAG: kynureninase [Alphaproteobacteria bacterium]|nr:kynureninase [Alphaproteobacteria bacterium]
MTKTRDACQALDARDPLADMRARFVLPEGVIYLDGNSLGALPKAVVNRSRQIVEQEWAEGLIRSWNDAGWYTAPTRVGAKIAGIIGAESGEVIVTDSTSVDLFKLLMGALALRPGRKTILGVQGDFPTDAYIAQGVASFVGAEFERVAADDLIAAIDEKTAVVCLTHVNYKTGFIHDMAKITAAAHAKGALTLWDLSHSAGVLDLQLGRADADLAVGCGYKYLNGGPGAPAYVFVAKRHQTAIGHPLTGWFGHKVPFEFAPDYVPAEGIAKMLTGTPPMLSLAALEAALDVFAGLDMRKVQAKASSLTELFIELSDERLTRHGFTVASPRNAAARGAQASLAHPEAYAVVQALIARGVIGDFRAPDVARFGLVPLYLSHVDVFDAVGIIDDVMETEAWNTPAFRTRKAVT